jgi:hypothetical protein
MWRDDTILLLEHAFLGKLSGIKIIPTTETEAKSVLKSKNSSGYDRITSKILKLLQLSICCPLTQFCIHSLLMSILPEHLKI